MERGERFKHNLILEYVMLDLFGSKGRHYHGLAGAFRDTAFCRKTMLKAIRKIGKRLDEIITMDERLRQMTSSILESLEHYIKETSEKVNNDGYIIAKLLDLIVHLLGYDWLDGKIHRHVFFYQNKGQEQLDWRKRQESREYYDSLRLDTKRRYMLVNFLKRNKIPKHQIARLLGLSIDRTNKILKEIENYEKETGKDFPEFGPQVKKNISRTHQKSGTDHETY